LVTTDQGRVKVIKQVGLHRPRQADPGGLLIAKGEHALANPRWHPTQ
jgi:hypothetical protein